MSHYVACAVLGLMVVCAVAPAVLFWVNLGLYRAPVIGEGSLERAAVLIPARDEAANIGVCLERVLASSGVELTVLVLDDASTDGTGKIVRGIAGRDRRVRLVETQSLPAGWNGKQRACWLLAQEAEAAVMVFLDADVRVEPEAVGRCAAQMRATGAGLVSGFPRQTVVGWMERLLLPLIHFVLLGFLPLGRMRTGTDPAYAAGCGQFLMVEREAYFASGGHAAIRETRHDGLRLPQAMRRGGFKTELVDLTELAEVRMYTSAGAVWSGLAKNATEGLAAPKRIVPLTVLLLMGQVMPVVLLVICLARRLGVMVDAVAVVALVASYVPRVMAVRRFRQPWVSAVLHPVGIVVLLMVQWYALGRQVLRRPVAWRARSYASGSGEEVS
jgi:hypothetical protein